MGCPGSPLIGPVNTSAPQDIDPLPDFPCLLLFSHELPTNPGAFGQVESCLLTAGAREPVINTCVILSKTLSQERLRAGPISPVGSSPLLCVWRGAWKPTVGEILGLGPMPSNSRILRHLQCVSSHGPDWLFDFSFLFLFCLRIQNK